MSTYNKQTKHPVTSKWEVATWADDYYGNHRYGVVFSNGDTFDPEKIKLETRQEKIEEKQVNPKEAIGKTKTQFHLVPPRVLKEVAEALTEGATKYGAYNFREAGVCYSTYYSSTLRHLIAWYEGEDTDKESGLNHITKAIGGLIVLRDSMIQGNDTDDRPVYAPKEHHEEDKQ